MSDPTLPAVGPPPLPSVETGAIPRSPRRWWFHLLVIGVYPPILGLLSVAEGLDRGPILSHSVAGLLKTCGIGMLMFALWFFLGWYASRATRDDLLLRWRGGFWPVPLGLGYSVALRIGIAVVAVVVVIGLQATHIATPNGLSQLLATDRPPVERLLDVSALRDNPVYFWLATTVVSFVVAGCREELWRSAVLAGMRKLWPTVFGAGVGQVAAVAVAAVLFGLGHLPQGCMGVAVTTTLGFGLGLIMVYHRSVGSPGTELEFAL